jgi:hypothetical protein
MCLGRQTAGAKMRLQFFRFSFADSDVAGRGGVVPSLLSTWMWGEYYSSHCLFGRTDSGHKGAPLILSFFFRWQWRGRQGRGCTLPTFDANVGGVLRQCQHHHLLPPPITFHHSTTLQHECMRTLFSRVVAVCHDHNHNNLPPPSNTRHTSGCCLPRPTTIFHHPLMRAYTYAHFQGWLLPLPTPSTLQCECMHTLVFEGGA